MKKQRKKIKSDPLNVDEWNKKELFLLEPRTLLIIVVTSILTLLIAFFGDRGAKYLTSVISPVPAHAPFDGTSLPIKQIPNWVKLTETERKSSYNLLPQEKLIPIPAYNPVRLVTPLSSLKWNDPNDDGVRNEKITYSVPYLGNYRLDGLENGGSHPGVDIKVPSGTPVYAISNGTVIKAENSNGGFGNHVVIQHNNVPSLEDTNQKTTIYSIYAHLESFVVSTNVVVSKGQLIGYTGSSGIATTPHLHFQIDNDSPAWHPYWPFTTADMRAAGYSFFEAINNGLGQENGRANTLNPMKYVQKYLGEQALVATVAPQIFQPQTISAPSSPPPPTPASDGYDNVSFRIQTVNGTMFNEGSDIKFTVQVFDDKGNLLSKPKFKDDISLSLLNGNGVLNRTKLEAAHLRTGISSLVKITKTVVGRDKLILRFRNKEFSSPEFEIQKVEKIAGFFVLPEKTELNINENVNIVVRAIDINGNKVTDVSFNERPSVSLTSGVGTVQPTLLNSGSFNAGETVVSFSASVLGGAEVIVTYRNQTFKSPKITIIEPPEIVVPPVQQIETNSAPNVESSQSASVQSEPQTSESNVSPPPYIAASPVDAIPSGTSAETTVEIQATGNRQQVTAVGSVFSDISENSVYYEALRSLKADDLIAGYSDGTFQPEREVTRAEAIAFILKAIDEETRDNINIVFPDVSREVWYADFVATAYDMGFVKGYPDGYFRPEAKVTLAEFFTMLLTAAKTDIDPQVLTGLPGGVNSNDWFAPYLQEAIRKNILEVQNNRLEPGKPLTRGEIAVILYKLRGIDR